MCLGHCQILAKCVGVKEMSEGRVLHKQIEGGQSRSHHFCERVTEQKWPKRVKAFTVEERQAGRLQEGPRSRARSGYLAQFLKFRAVSRIWDRYVIASYGRSGGVSNVALLGKYGPYR